MILCGLELLKSTDSNQQTSHLETTSQTGTHFENLCNKPLTISTRHGISSTHENVTIKKVAHRIPNEIPRDDTIEKERKGTYFFFYFLSFLFLFSFFILFSLPPRCQ
jgi:hypothetical protein